VPLSACVWNASLSGAVCGRGRVPLSALPQSFDVGDDTSDVYMYAVAPLVNYMFDKGKGTCFAYVGLEPRCLPARARSEALGPTAFTGWRAPCGYVARPTGRRCPLPPPTSIPTTRVHMRFLAVPSAAGTARLGRERRTQ
jgi:hypothetical protein